MDKVSWKQFKSAVNEACRSKHFLMLERLLNNEEFRVDYAVEYALNKCDLDVVRWLYITYIYYLKSDSYRLFTMYTQSKSDNLDIGVWLLHKVPYPDNKIYLCIKDCCITGRLDLLKYIVKTYPEIRISHIVDMDDVFTLCCKNKHFMITKWLLESNLLNLNMFNKTLINFSVVYCCENENDNDAFKTFELLLKKLDSTVDYDTVSTYFHNSCVKGTLLSAKLLLETYPDICVNKSKYLDNLFYITCLNRKLEVAQLLYNTFPNIDIYSKSNNVYTVFSILNRTAYSMPMILWLASIGEYYMINVKNNVVVKHWYDEERHNRDKELTLQFRQLGKTVLLENINQMSRDLIMFTPTSCYSKLLHMRFSKKVKLTKKLKDYFCVQTVEDLEIIIKTV